ncbi:MAG: hypothetical protein QOG15_3761 [Solirubrobacteraceae bacterium]|jgi:hypothetical protein|nr:hypothetical protein [Solirubrobacteraceae bacterium]
MITGWAREQSERNEAERQLRCQAVAAADERYRVQYELDAPDRERLLGQLAEIQERVGRAIAEHDQRLAQLAAEDTTVRIELGRVETRALQAKQRDPATARAARVKAARTRSRS